MSIIGPHIFQTIASQYVQRGIGLRAGSAYTSHFKEQHNRIVSENILRKATQLVNDLELARVQETKLSLLNDDEALQSALSVKDTLSEAYESFIFLTRDFKSYSKTL